MQLRILIGWAICLFVQLTVMLDEKNTIEAVFGHVDEPHTLAMLIYLATGAIEALLLHLSFVRTRHDFSSAARRHIDRYDDAVHGMHSPYPEDHAIAMDIFQSDWPRAEAIAHNGLRAAVAYFAVAVALIAAALVFAFGTIFYPLIFA